MSAEVGVILAGGRGTRMGLLGERYPKALLPVANRPLIAHHLRLLQDLGVREVFVVTGYRAGDVTEAVTEDHPAGLTLNFVEQRSALGSAHALGQLRPYIDGPFVAILGDYYFSAMHPTRLVRHLENGSSSAIAARREPNRRWLSEACELRVNGSGEVTHIVEKPSRPAGDLKGCGFYALQPEVFDAIARTPRTALRDEYELSVALELYLQAGHRLVAEEVIEWDQNLTHPEDVLECNLQWLTRHDRDVLVAEGAEVDPCARLERAVVGTGARVDAGAALIEVVVFDGVTLTDADPLCRALVTPGGAISVADSR